MFRCQLCRNVVPPGIPSHHFVLKRRSKAYPHRSRANAFVRTSEAGKRKEFHTNDPGGEGHESVRELIVCPDCAARNGQA
jgi:hypothetical protein